MATLETILDDIKSLPPEGLRTVESAVQELLRPSQQEAEREVALRVL